MAATIEGYEPWNGIPRAHKPPVKIALHVPDYDNHARKFVENHVLQFYDRRLLHIDSTQQGAPRSVRFPNGSIVRIFTDDQDSMRLEGDTWHELYVDEPAPRDHIIALQRGLSFYSGKTIMTMTPLSEPWIFDDIYVKALNLGGEREDIFAITAFPDENLKSHGGYLPDKDVEIFRAGLSEEEREARVHGRWMHLLGRVYKSFDERIHLVDHDLAEPGERTTGVTIDPHDRLPFAIGFWYVTRAGDLLFYDEWPQEDFEEFTSCNLTIEDYCHLLNDRGSHFWKLMDPNYGPRKSVITGLSIAEEFQLRGFAFNTQILDDLAAGHRAVDDYLRYDKDRPLDATNQPKLYVHRRCKNIIKAFKNYIWDEWRGRTAEGRSIKQKPKEKYKHFMDATRYTVMARPRFVERTERFYARPFGFRRGWE